MHEHGTDRSAHTPTVLVVGANGFLGGYIAAALHRQGWRVLRGVRSSHGPARDGERICDLTRMTTPAGWQAALQGVDAVVNAAGILREAGEQTFDTVHVRAPLALAQACVAQGVRRFVQISALGVPADGEFIASKHRFDEQLLQLPLQAVVLRPSVVYAASGSYGGTSLLRAIAGFPGFQWMPGRGAWPLQPVAVEDLADLVVASLTRDARGLYEVGGPAPMRLSAYQKAWRRWLRIGGERVLQVPEVLVSLQVRVWERLGTGPVGETMWRMLRRGNVTAPDAPMRLQRDLGITPRALEDALRAHPSQVQDRWQAQLYFLAPTLRFCVVALWLLSAWAGWRTPVADIERIAADSLLQQWSPVVLARSGALLDLLLGAWLLTGWRPRLAIAGMALSVIGYTLVLGTVVPGLWLDPLGGLAKNLLVIPALAVLWVLMDRR